MRGALRQRTPITNVPRLAKRDLAVAFPSKWERPGAVSRLPVFGSLFNPGGALAARRPDVSGRSRAKDRLGDVFTLETAGLELPSESRDSVS